MARASLDVVRVFAERDGRGGNPLGVFLDASALPGGERQAIAAELGFAETVFVDDRETARLRIFTPSTELPLAGHPLVGTSWLLHREGSPPGVLRPPAGAVATWQDGDLTWIRARPEDAPEFDLLELRSAAAVERLTGAPDGGEMTVAWAWEGVPAAGRVRARAFLPAFGVPEDEATGAAALRLTALVDRPLEIKQGAGSLLHTRPAADGTVELGGRVVAVERREYRAS